MRHALPLVMATLALTPPGALAGNGGARGQPAPIEASVTPSGKVVPMATAVEKLAESEGSGPGSPCAASGVMTPAAARALVQKVALEEDFYPDFVLAVASAESHFDVNSVSPRGAIGLMQLEPATARRYRVNICDPADNVRGGIKFLRDLHARYKNPLFILAAYNAGEATLLRYRGVPPFPETVRFVASVLNEFYDWPVAGGKRARIAATTRANHSPPQSQQSAPEPGAAEDHWKSGFVWNVE